MLYTLLYYIKIYYIYINASFLLMHTFLETTSANHIYEFQNLPSDNAQTICFMHIQLVCETRNVAPNGSPGKKNIAQLIVPSVHQWIFFEMIHHQSSLVWSLLMRSQLNCIGILYGSKFGYQLNH